MALLKCYIDDDDDEQSKRKKLPPWPESQHLWLKKQGCEGHLALHCHHPHPNQPPHPCHPPQPPHPRHPPLSTINTNLLKNIVLLLKVPRK